MSDFSSRRPDLTIGRELNLHAQPSRPTSRDVFTLDHDLYTAGWPPYAACSRPTSPALHRTPSISSTVRAASPLASVIGQVVSTVASRAAHLDPQRLMAVHAPLTVTVPRQWRPVAHVHLPSLSTPERPRAVSMCFLMYQPFPFSAFIPTEPVRSHQSITVADLELLVRITVDITSPPYRFVSLNPETMKPSTQPLLSSAFIWDQNQEAIILLVHSD
ncbi:hypothetical protein B0H14DRAFT_3854116 [Mycena olivaceomarginata]|nr:hypothetical protein B0H14DRAFT_3854116 [Mycena olivaceomarginata]